ncbi:hypothetical protein FACS1894110_20800 [Spirochaetia bacterium]|nr:hypothetical protein FACS1894110_20800 [Spirochaetia bacterium]
MGSAIHRANRYDKYGWAFISLAMLAFVLFTVYPIISSLSLSFKVLRRGDYVFGGLTNIKRLVGDKIFHRTIGNTFIFLVVQGPVMLMLALVLASILNSKLKMRSFYRTAIFIPCVMSLVSYSVLFKMMFATNGIINNFLMWGHLVKEPIFFIMTIKLTPCFPV